MSTTIDRDLFGEPVYPDPPIARNTDPWTSHAAARAFVADGRRDTQHMRIIRVMITDGRAWAAEPEPMTATEIGEAAGVRRCGRRMPELERKGLVMRDEARICRVTGERAITWRVK